VKDWYMSAYGAIDCQPLGWCGRLPPFGTNPSVGIYIYPYVIVCSRILIWKNCQNTTAFP
jgi:hypothetical protein